MTNIKKEFFTLLIGSIFFFSYLFIFHFYLHDRSICIFYKFFHFPCPTCGLSRAYIKFFSFEIEEAFKLHPLFLLFPLLFLIFVFRKRNIFNKLCYSRIFWILVIFLIAIVYLIRIIFLKDNLPF
jgi:hypothetical protein